MQKSTLKLIKIISEIFLFFFILPFKLLHFITGGKRRRAFSVRQKRIRRRKHHGVVGHVRRKREITDKW